MSSLLAYRKTVPWNERELINVNGALYVYEIPHDYYQQERWISLVKSGDLSGVVVRFPGGIYLTVPSLKLMGARVTPPKQWRESNYT